MSVRVFGWLDCIIWCPHECHNPGVPCKLLHCGEIGVIHFNLVLLMLWLVSVCAHSTEHIMLINIIIIYFLKMASK